MEPGAVVIVGAGAGGDATAITLRKQGYEGPVILIGNEEDRPYERPHLSKQFLVGTPDRDRVFLRAEDEYDQLGIQTISGHTVTGADADERTLTLDDRRKISYETLILATGSTPRRLPGAPNLRNILTLRSLSDATALKQNLDSGSGRVLIVGAGFIGAEVAASARSLGRDVTMIEIASVPLERVVGTDVGRAYAQIHLANGVDLRTQTSVEEWIVEGGSVVRVRLSDGETLDVDLALIAVGVSPNLDLAEELGLPISQNGVEVDEYLRVQPGIYAVGDIASHAHPVFGRRIRVEHWQVAQRQGSHVAAQLAGEPTPYTELPWFWSDQYNWNLQYVGNSAGFDRTILRGELSGEAFSVFYLKNNVIEATLSVNDGKTGRFSRDLIKNRVPVDQNIETQLADPNSDLRALVRSLA